MARKITAILCIIASLLTLAVHAHAEDWVCPACGTPNTGNFCSNCGEKKPQQAAAATTGEGISNVQWDILENGDIVITWDDSGNSPPYTVSYQAQYDGAALDPVNNRRATLEHLIPGETYTISVSNGKSESGGKLTVPIGVFTEFSSSAKKLVLKDSSFSISKVEQERTRQYELQIHFPQLRKDRLYKGKLVTKTPYGYGGIVWTWPTFEMKARVAYIYVNFSMHEFLEGIREDFEEIPTGQYTFELYLDGQLYADTSFNVTR